MTHHQPPPGTTRDRPSVIDNRFREIRCFFLLIKNHYTEILTAHVKGEVPLFFPFNLDQKKEDCTGMIRYCNEGLRVLDRKDAIELVIILGKMVRHYASVIGHTSESPFEVPNLVELKSTRFYIEKLRESLLNNN